MEEEGEGRGRGEGREMGRGGFKEDGRVMGQLCACSSSDRRHPQTDPGDRKSVV